MSRFLQAHYLRTTTNRTGQSVREVRDDGQTGTSIRMGISLIPLNSIHTNVLLLLKPSRRNVFRMYQPREKKGKPGVWGGSDGGNKKDLWTQVGTPYPRVH